MLQIAKERSGALIHESQKSQKSRFDGSKHRRWELLFISSESRRAAFDLGVSVTLDSGINVLDKDQAELEPSAAQHQEERERNDSHVTKVERSLQYSAHSTSMEVEVKGIDIDEKTGHASVDVSRPPPTVIFPR